MKDKIKRKKIKVNMYLYDDQTQALKKQSESTGVPFAEIVRRSIDKYLQNEGKNYEK